MNTQKTSVIIVGGYGKVGKLIAVNLMRSHQYTVGIAGRDQDKATSTAMDVGNLAKGVQFDLEEFGPHEKDVLSNYEVVVVCMDQKITDFAAYCISQSMTYLDITADAIFLKRIKKLHPYAEHHRALALVNVGLCPGLTNLMAKELIERNPRTDEVRTGIMLGLGEKHGKAAIQWTLDNLIYDFNFDHIRIQSFIPKKRFRFSNENKQRNAYRFNFSDQHSLKESYPLKEFSTWLCFNPGWATMGFHLLKKTGITKFLRSKYISNFIVLFLRAFAIGKKMCAISSVAYQKGNQIDQISVSGAEEALITAEVVVVCLEKILLSKNSYGVMDIQKVLSLRDVWNDLQMIQKFPKKPYEEQTQRSHMRNKLINMFNSVFKLIRFVVKVLYEFHFFQSAFKKATRRVAESRGYNLKTKILWGKMPKKPKDDSKNYRSGSWVPGYRFMMKLAQNALMLHTVLRESGLAKEDAACRISMQYHFL